MTKMTIAAFKQLNKVKKPSKYRAIKCVIDGIKFDSKKEGERYGKLKIMLRAGIITDLKLQPVFELSSCKYKADFAYYKDGVFIVEDVKGIKTPIYRLKKKMMLNELGISILET
jgi:hypothetical protein